MKTMLKNYFLLPAMLGLVLFSCEKETGIVDNGTNNGTIDDDGPKLVFKLKFDPTQERLNAFGQTSTLPSGHAAQNPDFHAMSAHFIELVPNAFTAVGSGDLIYKGEETSAGGANAVDFDQAIVKGEGETFFELPISAVEAGTYEYIRVSVTYQNYDIYFNIKNIPVGLGTIDLNNQRGRLASFVGFNNYITDLTPDEMTKTINDDRLQGFWALETKLDAPYSSFDNIYTGAAAATTVVNPISSSIPTPEGSCLVTGVFDNPLVITGEETEDVNVTLSFSTNQSLEWIDNNGNGELDFDIGNGEWEIVVDMGLRGLKPIVE